MAASHVGVIGDDTVVPYLLAALEDDHAYVRSSAAFGARAVTRRCCQREVGVCQQRKIGIKRCGAARVRRWSASLKDSNWPACRKAMD